MFADDRALLIETKVIWKLQLSGIYQYVNSNNLYVNIVKKNVCSFVIIVYIEMELLV